MYSITEQVGAPGVEGTYYDQYNTNVEDVEKTSFFSRYCIDFGKIEATGTEPNCNRLIF